MSFQLRFALRFTSIVAVILLVCFLSIYFLYSNFREIDFGNRLQEEGKEVYNLFSGTLSADTAIAGSWMEDIEASILSDREIMIYDSLNEMIFSYPDQIDTTPYRSFLNHLSDRGPVNLRQNGRQYAAIVLYEQGAYVFISAIDVSGAEQLLKLKWILMTAYVIALLITGLMSYWLSRQFSGPLLKLEKQMADITGSDLKQRIPENATVTEINQIAGRFNGILTRLETLFESQRSFVHHASHELRTPLATMLSHTEAALKNTLSEEEYKIVLGSLKQDQERMIELTNSLLLISQFEQQGYDKNWPVCRIDEILYDKISISMKMFPDIGISLVFLNAPLTDDDLNVKGNEALLKSMFSNLIRNGYLYSINKKVEIQLEIVPKNILVHVETKGNHLSEEEQKKILVPFFRGEQAKQTTTGMGLGLTIVHRILTMHKGALTYTPMPYQINRFTVTLPKAG